MLTVRLAILICFLEGLTAYCGRDGCWSNQFELQNVFGIWFGVNYAQHTPDLTDRPSRVGCITLYISDVTHEVLEDWVGFNGPAFRRNWTNPKWRSPNHNPWSDTPMSGSWLDVRLRIKRQLAYSANNIQETDFRAKRIRVLWDEDGQTEEQTYVITNGTMGFWKLEQWRMREREMLSRGLDVWYPNEPSLRADYVYIIESTPETLTLYHCSRHNGGRAFSLVLRRSPTNYYRNDWLETQRLMTHHELPRAIRHTTICAGCWNTMSAGLILICLVLFLAM